MYVIIVYDVGEKRVGKMLKLCRTAAGRGYLPWQESNPLSGKCATVLPEQCFELGHLSGYAADVP